MIFEMHPGRFYSLVRNMEKLLDGCLQSKNIDIIYELMNECVVGGYTKKGWRKFEEEEGIVSVRADKDAFVFYLRSPEKYDPFISNVKPDEAAISKALTYDVYKQHMDVLAVSFLF